MTLQNTNTDKSEKKDSEPHIEHKHEPGKHNNEHHEHSHEHKHEHEHAHEHKEELKKEQPKEKQEKPQEEIKKEEKKEIKSKIKKEEAIARGLGMHSSKKHCMYICRFIKNKSVDKAISDLEDVIKFKKAVPFKGEIPHRKGRMMSGRYPVKTAKFFIKLLKGLKGNALVNNIDIEKARIAFALANWASRPQRREGRRAKRANVVLKLRELGE